MNNKFIHSIKIDWGKVEENSYLKKIDSISEISQLSFTNNVTYFIGENGTGKSTLLEAIAAAYGFNPEGGTLNYRFSTYNDTSELSNAISISKGFKRPVLDEPESALSIQRQLTLFIQIAEMAKKGSQFIIVTHSPILMAIPNSSIWSFDNGKIHECDYEDTENYQILKMFISNRESFINQLLAENK